MLGKGLESLIPQGGGGSQKQPSDRGGEPPSHQHPPAPSAPQTEPEARFPYESEPSLERAFSARPKEKTHARTGSQDFIFHIEVEKIKPNPHQPRRDFSEESLRELADSIREFGIIQPLVVTKVEREVPQGTEVEYELLAGERRLMAAKLLGLERVPAIVRKVDAEKDRLEIAIIENLQRENLNPLEVARAFARLQDEFRLTQREIGTRLGKSREAVANTMRLLDLPTYIQDALIRGEISESHARLLLAITDQAAQEALFRDLLDRHLTTRELRNRVDALKSASPKKTLATEAATLSPELRELQERLSTGLGTPVYIERRGGDASGGGKITITFYSEEELRSIIEKLGNEAEL